MAFYDLPDLPLARAGEPFRGRDARARVHAHVERRVLRVGEAAVGLAILTAYGSTTIDRLYDQVYASADAYLRYIPEARKDAHMIGEILVPTREGGHVPLAQIARIEVVNGASIIARRENRRHHHPCRT